MKEDPAAVRAHEPEPFSSFLRKNNLLPPDFDLPEYDEEAIRKEYEEANSNALEKIVDHEDDKTGFEICIINKRNEGLIIPATSYNGEIHLRNVLNVTSDAVNVASMSGLQRARLGAAGNGEPNSGRAIIYGPKWQFLSESLQADLMKFIFTAGIRPELALCVEYLSWNKE